MWVVLNLSTGKQLAEPSGVLITFETFEAAAAYAADIAICTDSNPESLEAVRHEKRATA